MPAKTPKEVTDTIKKIDAAGQVIIQTYLSKLKQTIAELQEEKNDKTIEEGHAHYHGHEKCTQDHGQDEQSHETHEQTHKEGHDNGHHKSQKEGHVHGNAHQKEEHKNGHETHGHHENHKEGHDHKKDNSREDHHHEHEHQHEDKKEDDMPDWKKKALNSDPNEAPFGGSWNVESSVDATKEDALGKRKRADAEEEKS